MANKRKLILVFWLALIVVAITGCRTIGYYGQAIKGQYQILSKQEPISQKIADPATPPKLKSKFERVLEIRKFAQTEMQLPAGEHYLKYVDLQRPFVVWNVYAAPELSLNPKTWWYPVVGSVSYRGYFAESAARRYAARLDKKGLDVFVGGIPTYSTLGWFCDPLLNTFINEPDAELAEIIFHELAHQRLFIPGDTDFNEAFATAVAQEGVRRWLESKKDPEALNVYQKSLEQHQQFIGLVMNAIKELTPIYEATDLADVFKQQRKEEIIQQLRARHEALKAQWGGTSPFERWFSGPINNARLSSVATYYELVPMFQEILKAKHGNLQEFYREVKELGKISKDKRQNALKQYLPQAKAFKLSNSGLDSSLAR